MRCGLWPSLPRSTGTAYSGWTSWALGAWPNGTSCAAARTRPARARAAARWPRSGARGGVVSRTRRWASRPCTCGCGEGAMSAAHISFLVGYSTPLNVQRRSPPRPLVPMALAHLVLPVVGRVLQRSLELAPYVHAQGAGVCVRGRHAATQYVGSCEMIGGRTNGTGNRPHMSP